jgi:hypothetical protein
MWLGHPDPATALLEQVRHDPDAGPLGVLMKEWYRVFGSAPAAVRKAIEAATLCEPDLLDAIKDLPVVDRDGINNSKLGWLLKKNANRIVGGLEFRQGEADGRTAWSVMEVKPPASPASRSSVEETVMQWSGRI